jgi:hypothetical protein
MLDSLTIDHGRKARPTVGRCADCRREGVATTTNLKHGVTWVCELHHADREALWLERKAEREARNA